MNKTKKKDSTTLGWNATALVDDVTLSTSFGLLLRFVRPWAISRLRAFIICGIKSLSIQYKTNVKPLLMRKNKKSKSRVAFYNFYYKT